MTQYLLICAFAFGLIGAVLVVPSAVELHEAANSGVRQSTSLYRVTICQTTIECCDWIYGSRFHDLHLWWWKEDVGPPIQALGLQPQAPPWVTKLGVRMHPEGPKHGSVLSGLHEHQACKYNVQNARLPSGKFTCLDVSGEHIIKERYTHELVCQHGIRWYKSHARFLEGLNFPQCRCLRPQELKQVEKSILVLRGRIQCVDFPSFPAERTISMDAVARIKPAIDLNQPPGIDWNEDEFLDHLQGYWLDVKDETSGESRRTTRASLKLAHIPITHRFSACVRAPANVDVQLFTGLYEAKDA